MFDQAQALRNNTLTNDVRIIMVTSGKGGVGKSIIAANIAVLLAKTGKSVLLFDADVGFANSDILLGVTPKNTLKDFFLNKKDLRDIVYPTKYGVWLLSSGADVQDIVVFKSESKNRLFGDFLRFAQSMDYIIIDTGTSMSYFDELRGLYEVIDSLILVTTGEPTALMNTYTIAKLMAMRGITPEVHVVVNMAKNIRSARRVLERFVMVLERFAGIDVTEQHIMLFDNSVKNSVVNQIPLVEHSARSQPSLCIRRITNMILKSEELGVGKFGFVEKIKSIFGIGG